MTETVLDLLVAKLRSAAIYNRHDIASPQVVLWTDGERLWSKVVSLLREAMPELLSLEASGINDRDGPSTWLRYQLTRTAWRETPILYLPGVPRQAFRSAAGFPEIARHLFALQYQGQFWTQVNGKDWTPSAFMSSTEGGLALDLARDRDTLDALTTQLPHVLRSSLDSLKGRRLEAGDFHTLAASDPIGLLLEWMAAHEQVKSEMDPQRWAAFAAQCKDKFALHPDKDGVLTAVERLVHGGGIWDQVWKRYREAPKTYGGVRKALDLVQTKDLFDETNDKIPANNRRREDVLRAALLELAAHSPSEARSRLQNLCTAHAPRASTLWAELGEAPLAQAATHFRAIVEGMQAGSLGNDWAAVAKAYVERGWVIDASAWKAYAAVRDAKDVSAVAAALRAVYLPWLQDNAERLREWISTYPMASPAQSPLLQAGPGRVLVFVDGLRCDLAVELERLLLAESLEVSLQTRWSALPTVTATAKPAWRPVADGLGGSEVGDGFEPVDLESSKPLKTAGFRKLLDKHGFAVLDVGSIGEPSGSAWTEVGNFDHDGHALNARLAWQIEDELLGVCARIRELIDAGWKEAILVTDHGWLLVPGGLPKVDLPSHLTVSRWSRCAVPQPGAKHAFKEVPWFWGGGNTLVLAPGVSSFKAGLEYAHGGLSVQEALTAIVTVKPGKRSARQSVKIENLKWVGMRLRVTLSGGFVDTLIDIRTKPSQSDSSLLSETHRLKPPSAEGEATLLVESDENAGVAAVLVIVRGADVIAKQAVTIGENE